MEKIDGNENVEKGNFPRPFTELDYSKFPRGSSTLYDSFDDKNVIVRKSFVGGIDDRNSKGMSYSEKEKYLRDSVSQFKEILKSLGIRMAKTDYIVGDSPSSPKDPTLFGVTERINGEGLDRISDWSKEMVDKIDDIYAKVIRPLLIHIKEMARHGTISETANLYTEKRKRMKNRISIWLTLIRLLWIGAILILKKNII
jgi:hypothetical protein